MAATRLMPTEESRHLIDMTREVCRKELAPRVDAFEREGGFPEHAFRTLGELGLLSLPYPEEYGGGGQTYEVYLQVVEEIATVWMAVAVGVSVHSLTCYPVAEYGTDAQREALLPDMLSGSWLGGYCLSEADSGSDVGSMSLRADRDHDHDGDGYRLHGAKMWISHASHANFYTTFARTSDDGSHGLSCFIVPADAPGLSFGKPEDKMGLHGDPVAQVIFDDTPVSADRRIGAEGQGMPIALHALDNGRLGIAAAATGLAQAALNVATKYAKERKQFGRAIADFQGLAFLLADMEAAVTSARATYLYAARLKDAGRPYTKEASVAKLVATDAAMRVTTDAVQVLGGYGYTRDFPVERYMREAKVTQIFEGTNQIQRLVISRQLLRERG
ncbi:MAG: acyl-CoA dehydrogenase family protein [Dermatophilaceae bacterium]|jgi:alkylation response protein AidB-like acyl-CoA dehydrogenase|nr:acyl-CoA dehydrogenase family protein [Actinomycetales bacterium]MBP8881239.1 acyl-CoA dehydrogenase family protein [Dermatophilaceae bacterium]MBP9918395.1 acyl-CoA dehydrogenase family protein [Dermatophilaceae bacterium]